MAKKHLTTRLSPELIERILATAESKKISVEDMLSVALDSHDLQSKTPELLTERIEKLELGFINLAASIRDFLPMIIEAEERSYRSQNAGRLMIKWAELVVENKGMPTPEQWRKERDSAIEKYRVERQTDLKKRRERSE